MIQIIDMAQIEPTLYHVTTSDGAVFVVEQHDSSWRWRYYDDPSMRKVGVGGFESREACLEGMLAYLQNLP
jgi:hypothetical protein